MITKLNQDYGMSVIATDYTLEPGKATYKKMHQCYSDLPILDTTMTDEKAESVCVERLLNGNRGHFSPYEAASITMVCAYLPHSALQQLLRSRIGVSPAVQSFRYTSNQIINAATGVIPLEQLIYLRPTGEYHDREAGVYSYTDKTRAEDLAVVDFMVEHVAKRIAEGMPEEQARGMLPFDYRQHASITFNARSLMGFFDRRGKKDAQLEVQILSGLFFSVFSEWMPQTAEWYKKHRLGKAILAP
jgi:thymidylate synthase (FAD)